MGHAGVGPRVRGPQALQHQGAAVQVEPAPGRESREQAREGLQARLLGRGCHRLGLTGGGGRRPGPAGDRPSARPRRAVAARQPRSPAAPPAPPGRCAPAWRPSCGSGGPLWQRGRGEARGQWLGPAWGWDTGGAGRRRTQHGHHEVLAGLPLGVLGHTRVGASLVWPQVTQLEAAPPGDHTTCHTAFCGTEGGGRTSPAQTQRPRCHHWAQTEKSRDSLRGRLTPALTRLERPWEPLNHPPLSYAHRETEAQTWAGPLAIYVMAFPSLDSFDCSGPYNQPLPTSFTGDISSQGTPLP